MGNLNDLAWSVSYTYNYYIGFTKETKVPDHWIKVDHEVVKSGPKRARFTFAKRYDAPSLWTDFSGNQLGCKSWPSKDDVHTIQTTIFGQGKSWDKATTFEPWAYNPTDPSHKYSVEWDSDYFKWLVADKVMREVQSKDVPAAPYWTIQWTGGKTDLNGVPYTASIKGVNIMHKDPACQFRYKDKSGKRDSVEIIKTGCSDTDKVGAATKPMVEKMGESAAVSGPPIETAQATSVAYVASRYESSYASGPTTSSAASSFAATDAESNSTSSNRRCPRLK
ncbi:uncharacterized protein BCR38DRAFT_520900 [Pseudomassariella vexata]|uniref:GH16 domain-containing protein n=1 Tax=Pseudomassariella vexata TaxID=1141098 RepID=A0A1Y2EF59_9PEZI|nr:uncharacterized protein BCR38DRAFT_520900 [Pseudomassariella vexata]ORY70037.1 hypothetical protein BCR38DRAFT_520900 [Pseudomassariella vexata]